MKGVEVWRLLVEVMSPVPIEVWVMITVAVEHPDIGTVVVTVLIRVKERVVVCEVHCPVPAGEDGPVADGGRDEQPPAPI